MDGSCMGNHWVLGFALVGKDRLRYPAIMKGLPGQGHELEGAKQLIRELPRILRSYTPELLLY
ncbi:MAG: hypothetical protein ACOC6C_03555, partial [Verrucomicrobiota bacterium]